jgi:hypothetical protein
MPLICPIDKKDDFIQSVPALVSGGTVTGSFSGPSGGVAYVDGKYGYTAGSTQLTGTMSSKLAQALAAPNAPREISFWTFVGWSFLTLLSVCIIIGPYFTWRGFKNSVTIYKEDQDMIFTPGLKLACIFLLALGFHPLFWIFIPIVKNKIVAKLDYPHRNQLWRQAYQIWQKLFYCHRCGVVFNPETGESFPPSELGDYLRVYEFET